MTKTKAELEQENIKLKAAVENQSHLAEAVNAKDAEISAMRTRYDAMIEALKKKHAEELGVYIRDKDAMAKDAAKTADNAGNVKVLSEKVELLIKENQRLAAFVNNYKDAFKSLLKTMQGGLDNAISLENILYSALLEGMPRRTQ